ncbi:MAG: T9SS type A sorting domain-containing protein [Flavobacteriales bacterium]
MIARYALLPLAAFALSAHAQLLNVTNGQGQVVNGQMVTLPGQADASLLTASLYATSNASAAVNVNVKRYELNVQTGTENYFCWGVCYDALPAGTLPFWGAGQEAVLPMSPGVTLDNFHAYHVPLGHAGISTYRYVWYNTASPTDTVYVDIRFDVAAVGIEEIVQRPARIDAAPNPAIGQDVQLDLSLDRAGLATQVIIHDMLGATVKRYTVTSQQSRWVLPTTEWTPGVYFVSLERNGALLATKRVVVAR